MFAEERNVFALECDITCKNIGSRQSLSKWLPNWIAFDCTISNNWWTTTATAPLSEDKAFIAHEGFFWNNEAGEKIRSIALARNVFLAGQLERIL